MCDPKLFGCVTYLRALTQASHSSLHRAKGEGEGEGGREGEGRERIGELYKPHPHS